MSRRSRCVLPGVPCHITQRGVDRRETFTSDGDRLTYLQLLWQNLRHAEVRLLGWCLMPNHVHLIAQPEREDSLAVLLRRVHGRYAQYYNARAGRSGHLWQNRFFACVLSDDHLRQALAYVDLNPVRAGIAANAAAYRWSSAAAHLSGTDAFGLIDEAWWSDYSPGESWRRALGADHAESDSLLRACTHSGRPFGNENFVRRFSERFDRHWARGRPKKPSARMHSAAENNAVQAELF
jgi:putative transposase